MLIGPDTDDKTSGSEDNTSKDNANNVLISVEDETVQWTRAPEPEKSV